LHHPPSDRPNAQYSKSARSLQTSGRTPEDSIKAKITALLNKLTPDNFDSICNQIIARTHNTKEEDAFVALPLVIDLILTKAKDEALWSALYANLCLRILAEEDIAKQGSTAKLQGDYITGDMCLRQYLSRICRTTFDNGWTTRRTSVEGQQNKSDPINGDSGQQLGDDVPRSFEFSDKYYDEQRSKRQGLGLLKFAGELFARDLIPIGDIAYMLSKILEGKELQDDSVESVCRLLNVTGSILESKAPDILDHCLGRLRTLRECATLCSRLRFMLDVSGHV
jgi:translation initiation factor 4G